jgi:hypothetical protein
MPLYAAELLVIAQLVTGSHTEGAHRDKLALLLYGIYCVSQPILLCVVLRLHLYCFFLFRIILVFSRRLGLCLRDGLEYSLRVASEWYAVVVVGIGSVVWIEGGQLGEDELVGAGLGGRTCSRTSCGGRSTAP